MKYKLIIDKNAEEEIIAIVHTPSMLTQQIENLVCSFSGVDSIMGYREDEMRKLSFEEIECITIQDRKVIAIDSKVFVIWKICYLLILYVLTNLPWLMNIVFYDLMQLLVVE